MRMDEEEIADEIRYEVHKTRNPHTLSLSHSLTLSLSLTLSHTHTFSLTPTLTLTRVVHITGVHDTFRIETKCAQHLSLLIAGVRNTSFYHVRDRHLILRMDEEEIADEIRYEVHKNRKPQLSLFFFVTLQPRVV